MVVGVSASPAWAGCAADRGYYYSAVKSNYLDLVKAPQAPPGHTLSITLTAGLTATGTVGGQVSGDVSAIIAGAQASVNASIALSLSVSVTVGDSFKIPSTVGGKAVKVGYLHAGAERDSMNWAYGQYTPTCTFSTIRSGTANLPWYVPAFWATYTYV
jgi:hypothetical protein